MVIDAEYGVSRRTLLEPNADIEQIKIHDTLWNHIIVPEQQMHEVLGIQETKARA
jgi:predicted nucleic acid-binding protein